MHPALRRGSSSKFKATSNAWLRREVVGFFGGGHILNSSGLQVAEFYGLW